MVTLASTVGQHASEETIREYVKKQGIVTAYTKLHNQQTTLILIPRSLLRGSSL